MVACTVRRGCIPSLWISFAMRLASAKASIIRSNDIPLLDLLFLEPFLVFLVVLGSILLPGTTSTLTELFRFALYHS